MRVRFGVRTNKEEQAFGRFAEGVDRMFATAVAEARPEAWWRRELGGVCPELGVELRRGTLVLRASERKFVPLADFVASRAPERLSVVSGAPALALAEAVKRLGTRTASLQSATLRAGFSRGHLLEIVVNWPGARGTEDELAAAETLVWSLLGERKADAWVGSVKVAPAPRGGALRVVSGAKPSESTFAWGELPAAVDAAIQGLYRGLPAEPHVARDDGNEWTMFELEPEEGEDWADEDDLVMATTCVPELLKCRLSKQPFSSLRFSRHGELFFHLKYSSRGEPESRLEARRIIEDAFDKTLLEARLGRVVGAGLGLRYSYVLVATLEAERALPLLVAAGQRAELPQKSWLLPLDTDLAAEWCGVWPKTLAPPS